MFKPKVTVLVKHDIRSIPFDQLYTSVLGAARMAVGVKNRDLQAAWSHSREKYIQGMIAKLEQVSDNTEGLEESVRETVGDQAPTLDPDEAHRVRVEAYKKECEDFSKRYTLVSHSSWLPPQIVAHFGNWRSVKDPLDESGATFSPRLTLARNLGSEATDWEKGLYYFTMYAKRGDLIEKQYQEPANNYCALVPLILSGFKKHQNINYSQWSRDMLEHIVEPQLYEAMVCEVPDLSSQELLGIRDKGMEIRTGKNAGGHRSPVSTYKLYGVAGTAVGELPWLAQVMMTQIWCAHPSNRNKYMVLDPKNWDGMPEPLVSVDVFKAPAKSVFQPKAHDAFSDDLPPWLQRA